MKTKSKLRGYIVRGGAIAIVLATVIVGVLFSLRADSPTAGSASWNTFLGGSGEDFGNAAAVDGSGNVYVTGYSWATWGSPVNPFISGAADSNGFVAKLD